MISLPPATVVDASLNLQIFKSGIASKMFYKNYSKLLILNK